MTLNTNEIRALIDRHPVFASQLVRTQVQALLDEVDHLRDKLEDAPVKGFVALKEAKIIGLESQNTRFREALEKVAIHWWDPKLKENEGLACMWCDLKEATADWRNIGHDDDCIVLIAKEALE